MASSPASHLLNSDLFNIDTSTLLNDERIDISYRRARAISRAYDLKATDIHNVSPKFWELHQDPINLIDLAAFTLTTVQYNLIAGILIPFAEADENKKALLSRVLQFDVSAIFMLTEIGHGLDARRLETTATLLPSGEIELHTPNFNAAKFMPPSWPRKGLSKVGIVFARLIVQGEDRGIRPFIVPLSDGEHLRPGITVKLLPRRSGSKPLDHSVTTFNYVKLPSSALLGSIEVPPNERDNFFAELHRVNVGTLAAALILVTGMKRAVYVAGTYSCRRCIAGPKGEDMAIISLRTQHRPILHALAQTAVFEAYAQDSIQRFCDKAVAPSVRNGVAATFKALLTKISQQCFSSLASRCGAMGLYEFNHIIEGELELRGASIAEGDTLALSIRLGTELLLNRYQMPTARDPSSLLAQYENGLFQEGRDLLATFKGGHRGDEYNSLMLQRCQPLVEAIGYRLAYEAALKAGVSSELLELFTIGVMLQDLSWFTQHLKLSREDVFQREARALDKVLPNLKKHLADLQMEPYCTAPILSQDSLNSFVQSLETRGEDSTEDISPSRAML